MNRTLRGAWLVAVGVSIGSCNASESASDNSEMSVEEARALNDAAEMLAERRLPDDATDASSAEPAAPEGEEPDR